MTPTLLPNLFPPSFNQMLRDRLQRSAEWRLCLDEHYLPGMNAQAHSDTGFVYYTYTNDRDWDQVAAQDPARGYFNGIAESILNTALVKLGHDQAVIMRIMWNYYNRSSQGIMHKDQQTPGFYSMVYNLSDTDGGTEIQGEFYPGAEGSAIVFPSELDHKGFGPKIQPNRFVLNCIFSVETPINNAIKGA
jgi:hypothetical protein